MKALVSKRRVLPLMTVILLVGLLGLVSQRLGLVHAATTITVTSCPNETTLLGDIASAGPGGTVRFSIKKPCTISINPTLVISQDLTLDNKGQRVTLDGGSAVQVLHVNPSVTFILNAFTVANGVANKGGGLDNFGTVTISKSIFDRNSVGSSGTGGGIENETSSSTVTISNSTFSNNSAGNGGGLDNNGTVIISNSTFANSTSNGTGGGIENETSSSTVTISNSTFSNNAAFGSGGGLDSAGTVTISNSTFDHNTAIGGSGGGLSNSGMVTIKNSTFANNSASGTGGVGGGGIDNEPGNTVQIAQSIVANNSAPIGPNCKGVITDQGYNLESGTDCGFVAPTDLQNTNPLLGPLANNGGPTQTLALLHGSPAINKIPVALCPSTDQRGFKRPDDSESVCDIGAFESGASRH